MCTRKSRTTWISAVLLYGCSLVSFADTAPSAQSDARFILKRLDLQGVSAYSAEELLVPYRDLLGKEIAVGRVFQIADEMTARYRRDGWTYSRVLVPEQDVTSGEVRLQAVEGYASDLQMKGDGKHAVPFADQIRHKLEEQKPLNEHTLERYALLMNDVPGASVAISMAPASDQFGGMRLATQFSQTRFEGSVGASNRGSRVLGPTQIEANVSLNSLLSAYDSTRVTYVTATQHKELQFVALAETLLVSSEGTRLEITASHSKSQPGLGEDFEALNLETNASSFGVTLSHPFLRSRRDNLTARVALDYHDGETRDAFDQPRKDHIPALRAGVTYDLTDQAGGINVLDLQISQGLSTGNATRSTDESSSRPGVSASFTKAELYLARLQSLGARWSVLFGLQGQLAGSNLLSSEQFAFGGPLFGRAYDPSELVGDSGLAGKLEARWALGGGNTPTPTATLYAFYDAGIVYRRNPQPGEKERDSGTAAGGGVRFGLFGRLSGYVEAAVPLTRTVAAQGNKDTRFFGGLTASF